MLIFHSTESSRGFFCWLVKQRNQKVKITQTAAVKTQGGEIFPFYELFLTKMLQFIIAILVQNPQNCF